ncbi:hypothetical protein [Planococcus halocryophilus]|uniref:hypothetical protein n=1 Tax=Planococcus halocryophilus TaxID=1215089 RepID=UPI001F109BF8|nr:hypothetical protein [Planococcus halocryophilus]MCH4825183.1 hypothetical protein [Planococcus halocryophilus]
MANIWIYHGSTTTVKSTSGADITLRDGQYVMETYSAFGQNYSTFRGEIYFNGWKKIDWTMAYSLNSSTTSFTIPNGAGRFTRMWTANSRKWGSHNYHAASGGNYYTVRYSSWLRNSAGTIIWQIPAGWKVIIGRGQGFFNPNRSGIRCWGFRRSDGTIVETDLLFIDETPTYNTPSSYVCNTI